MPPSTPSVNINVLKQAFNHLNARNINGCLSLMRPDFIINIADMPYQKRGHKAWRNHAQILFAAIPDVKVHVEDIIAAEDKVAVRVRIKGTHQGEFLGNPPTGKTIEYISHEIYRFENGELAEEWICSDTMTLLRQVGALSTNRLVSMWLSGYRFWFGLASGVALAGAVISGVYRA
ncbi:snoaL-like polyketide cyclase domain-containing protein [Penicillium samsonianum]|uniref:snoaL-like polyketide cyclase domain-containing protein n=1 Tax=Penicillium samsonianum TaxID=1882272 RepID=UPI002547FF42|nr:snoaL-like polyketide cyclase domain-containing protein [Penicillium samsonianum]KAJ6149125.1 snoaL-like polyketide cyclase domain-containing protein [Penicillium samsonianum]